MTNLITGGAGFIGSHLAERLLARGEAVTVLDDLSTGRRANIEHLAEREEFEFVRGDVRDSDLVDELAGRSDRVFHLAAVVGVEEVIERPLRTISVNTEGTRTVLRAASREQTPLFLASTSEIYGKRQQPGGEQLREDDDWMLGPTTKRRWAYACTKAEDEFMALAHAEERDLPVVIGRFFNVVGPRQSGAYGMVIPTLVGQALRGEPLTVYGDGQQTRCFLHVEDAVRAVTGLMDASAACGNVYNVGREDEISINDLAESIVEMTGSDSEIRCVPYEDAFGDDFEEMRRRTPSTERLRSTTGFEPERSLAEILRDVIAHERSDGDVSA